MNAKEFIKIYNVAKNMKCDIIEIYNDMILGTDSNLCTLSLINLDYDTNTRFIYNKNSIVTFFKPVENQDEIILQDGVLYYRNSKYTLTEFYYYRTTPYNIYSNTMNNIHDILYEDDNIRRYPIIEQMLSMKKADGMIKYCPEGTRFLMTLFGNVFPVNKSDTLSLKIYDTNDNVSFISCFIINKKKLVIYKFFRMRYLV